MPTLNSADMITNAQLGLGSSTVYSGDGGAQVNAYKVNSTWGGVTAAGLNWSNKPAYDPIVQDYNVVSSTTNSAYYWNITDIVKDWYKVGNTGLMLAADNESAGYISFLSSDCGEQYAASRPVASLFYINNSGLENYWTYHSQDAGRAGTGYINDYNGNLIFKHDDLSMTGNKMPVNIKHVFNSNDKNIQLGFGQGWRLNYSQKFEYQSIGGQGYYIYTDEDGTKHYFKYVLNTPKLQDELNIGLTLTVETNNTYTIADKKENVVNFWAAGDIRLLSDSNGNLMNLDYYTTSTNGVRNLKTLTDGVGRVTTLIYNAAGLLSSITDPSQRQISYTYLNGMLNTITYPDTKVTSYNYDANANFINATNYDVLKISYEYNTLQPFRVKKTSESNNATLGDELNIKYGNNSTSFTDENSKTDTYLFDNGGKTTTVKDSDDNAIYYKYSDGLNAVKMGTESKLQKTTVNYLMDHNAEYNAAWTNNNAQAATYSSEDKYIGNQSLKIASTASNQEIYHSQYVTLAKGKTYTFSSYVKTNGITATGNAGAALAISYLNASSQWVYAPRKYINGTNNWDRYETSFTVAADAYSATNNNLVNVWVAVEVMNSVGTAYFDCTQLEEGNISNRYNLIENGDFRAWDNTTWNALYWNKNYGCDAGDYVAYDTLEHPKSLDKDVPDWPLVYKLNGHPGKNKGITQTLNMSGKIGDSFVIGGWAKANSVPLSSSRLFELSVGFQKSGGAITWNSINFNPDTNEWQYISGAVVSKMDYDKVWVYACYYDNANLALFDGIQLYKEEFGTSYGYDSKGNVLSSVDLAKQNSKFEYNATNDLIKTTDAKGNLFQYGYDTKHNVINATTAENVVYSFSYDGSGNPLTSKVGDASTFMKSSAEYTPNGNYMKSLTDSSGNASTYNYNETKGVLDSVNDPKGKTTSYNYDPLLDRLKSVSKVADGQTITNSYDYLNDRISAITHNSFSYNFGYDALGNNNKVDVGTQNLITNTFEARTSNLLKSTYANSQSVSSKYDSLDRIITKLYNNDGIKDIPNDNYMYDASGNLGYHEDLINGTNYRYIYDTADRLVKVQDNKGSVLTYGFDQNNNTNKVSDKVNNNYYTTAYGYDNDNKPTITTYNRATTNTITQSYDNLGRASGKTLNTGVASYNTILDYLPGANGATTSKVGTITNNGVGTSYTYDANGNIETITQNGQVIKYYYNELNEVTREDNQVLNKTITNTYDAGGNITNKKEYPYSAGTLGAAITAYPYVYGDANWKDKLTSYNGNAITYDSIGNPLTYNGNTYTWEEGRQLAAISGNGNTISYKYNDAGIRTQKIVNGVTTNYHLVGNKVTYEDNGTDKIYYNYDSNGKVVSMSFNVDKSHDLYDNVGTNSPVALSGTNSAAEKFKATELFDKVSVSCPSWSNNIGNLTLNLYKWNTDYNTTISGSPVAKKEFVNFTDNQFLDLSVQEQSPGDYLWVINNPSETVGVWKNDSSNNSSTAYLNGSIVSGDYVSKISYKAEDYYYIRNAQSDIIGLIDKTGSQVVSYNYDTWGKLILATGTLAATVGVKNPYLYRGYRYDTETGLYYLQSRYYNADWGRFINADAIVGQPGKLLSNNVFAYCQNNCVNAYDPSGFQMIAEDGGGSGYYSAVPLDNVGGYLPNSSQIKGILKSAAGTGIEGGISSVLKSTPKSVILVTNRVLRRAGQEIMIPVKGASIARGFGSIEKIGVVGVGFAGYSVWDNYHSGYNRSEALGRSAIDVGVVVGVIIFGLSNPVGWTMVVGFGVGMAAESYKNYRYKKE